MAVNFSTRREIRQGVAAARICDGDRRAGIDHAERGPPISARLVSVPRRRKRPRTDERRLGILKIPACRCPRSSKPRRRRDPGRKSRSGSASRGSRLSRSSNSRRAASARLSSVARPSQKSLGERSRRARLGPAFQRRFARGCRGGRFRTAADGRQQSLTIRQRFPVRTTIAIFRYCRFCW
jgi:hypothetical protein